MDGIVNEATLKRIFREYRRFEICMELKDPDLKV